MRRQSLKPLIVFPCGDRSAQAITNFDTRLIPSARVQSILDVLARQRIYSRLQRLVMKKLKMRRVLKRVVAGKLLNRHSIRGH